MSAPRGGHRWIALAMAGALGLALVWWARAASPPGASGRARPEAPARGLASARDADARPARPAAAARRDEAADARSYEAVATGVAECDGFARRFLSCDRLPHDAKIAVTQAARGWREQAALGGDVRSSLTRSCSATSAIQGRALDRMGC